MDDDSIFSFTDYKSFLKYRISRQPRSGHGFRGKLAVAIRCQPAYVSHVLRGSKDFSVDQIEGVASFLSLDMDEKEYLIWLLEYARAGSVQTRAFFRDLIARKQAQYLKLRQRGRIHVNLDLASQAIYYSDTLYAKIHMLVRNRDHCRRETIARSLGCDQARVDVVVGDLLRMKLITETEGELRHANDFLIVDKGTDFIAQYHTGWRLEAIQASQRRRESDTQYTMLLSIGRNDRERIKRLGAKYVEKVLEIVRNSPDECLVAVNLDVFGLVENAVGEQGGQANSGIGSQRVRARTRETEKRRL